MRAQQTEVSKAQALAWERVLVDCCLAVVRVGEIGRYWEVVGVVWAEGLGRRLEAARAVGRSSELVVELVQRLEAAVAVESGSELVVLLTPRSRAAEVAEPAGGSFEPVVGFVQHSLVVTAAGSRSEPVEVLVQHSGFAVVVELESAGDLVQCLQAVKGVENRPGSAVES